MTTTSAPPRTTEEIVRRYYAVVADLGSSEEELRELLDPAVRLRELPNLLIPRGASHDLEGTLRGFRAGKSLLREQTFDVHDVLVDGGRAAVRATWRGVVGVEAGGFRVGQELIAHIAALVTVREGRIVEHATYDCYEPFERSAVSA